MVEHKKKAFSRANRNTKAPFINNTSKLQEALFNIGAYKGLKDRSGKELSFEKAVDGIFGNQTKIAINRAKQMGYNVNVDTGVIKKNQQQVILNGNLKQQSSFSPLQGLLNIFKSDPYIPSTGQNLQAVMEHKVKTGVTEPYIYVSPKEGKLYRLQGNKILYETPIASGVNFNSDGYTELPVSNGRAKYDRSITTSSTPAGVFTLAKPYNGYGDEPMFHLIEAERGNPQASFTQVAIHAPATADRQRRMMNGEKNLTYGCIQLPSGETKCQYNKGNINQGDSVYVEPTVKGNFLYEDKDGHIKTYFKETPKRVSGKTWGTSFNVNNVKYNTGY